MRKLLSLLSLFAIVLSCSSDETSTPVTPPPAPIVKYTITLTAGEGGTVSTTGGEYEAGQTVSVTATPQGEYVFTSWSDGNTNATRTITVSSNSTLTANFEKRKYPLTINFEGEGVVIEEIVNAGRTTDYDSGTTVKLTAQAAAEWVFVGWTGDIESTEESVQIVIGEPKEVRATFEKKKYPLTVNIEGEGEVLEEIIEASRTTDYDSGTTVKLTAQPADEWLFTGWSGDIGEIDPTENPIQLTIIESKTVTATFEKKKYPLTVNIEGEGEVLEEIIDTGKTTDYDSGTTVKLTPLPGDEWVFSDWRDDNGFIPVVDSLDNSIQLKVLESRTVKVRFAKKVYFVNINVEGEGEVLQEKISTSKTTEYDSGTTIKLTAIPANNWVFAGWKGIIDSTELEVTLIINDHKDVSATFKYAPQFKSKSPRYSAINETTSNFYNQFYFESYMRRDIQNSLGFDENGISTTDRIVNEGYFSNERDMVYYDFDKNGSLDLFGFGYWANGDGTEWGTRDGKYFLIKDYFSGNREKIVYDTQVSFPSGLDLADIDGDNQLEVIVGSTEIHQNYLGYFREEKPIEVIKIDENFNIFKEFVGPQYSAHDMASGDVDNDGDNDILLWGLNYYDHNYNDESVLSPLILFNNGNGSFEKKLVFSDTSMLPKCENCNDSSQRQRITDATFNDLMDINNDGYLDIIKSGYLTNSGSFGTNESEYNIGLFIYYGDGTGEYQIENSLRINPNNSEGYRISTLGATYLDYDNDGDLDIFVVSTRAETGDYIPFGNETIYYNNYILFAFKNNGDAFEDVTSQVFDKSRDLTKTNFSHFYDINARDVDGDGDFDLVPAKTSGWFYYDQLNNLYWENQGGFFSIKEEGGYNKSRHNSSN